METFGPCSRCYAGAAVIALATVVGVVGALVFSYSQEKSYEATASLLFRPLLDLQVTGLPPSPGWRRPAGGRDEPRPRLVGRRTQRAAARLGPEYTPKRVEDDVEISEEGKPNIVAIKATAPTGRKAAQVANAVAAAFVTFRRAGLRNQAVNAVDRVRTQLQRRNLPRPVRRALRLNLHV